MKGNTFNKSVSLPDCTEINLFVACATFYGFISRKRGNEVSFLCAPTSMSFERDSDKDGNGLETVRMGYKKSSLRWTFPYTRLTTKLRLRRQIRYNRNLATLVEPSSEKPTLLFKKRGPSCLLGCKGRQGKAAPD
ncbi:hypothetical protein CEXT_596321 [Caerostris extrusa]|uniref:Uncharacterized protein n=1 Tax=Caerostris extrusa TaxID=172846 RepID=A0AAV4TDS6_CAEEX|nr:hypothetical protein CEXT_596321 [Caerostris extrusa]